jgi:pimeloyl-ACP methyl ester carboxylesterase
LNLVRIIRTAVLATLAQLALGSAAAAQSADPLLQPYAAPQILARLPDGRRIHLLCMGQGTPTVIMTAGLGDWSGAWRKVQAGIGKQTRACAWDRAGFGFSDPSPERQDLPHTTADLEAALKSAGVAAPYVIVGHSMGGYESLAFADRHRAEVVGMVLVDPSTPGQDAMFQRVAPRLKAFVDTLYAQAIGQIRACAGKTGEGCEADAADYPAALKAAMAPYEADPARATTEASLYVAFPEATAQAVNPSRTYGDMPLVVLSAMNTQADLPPGAPPEALAELPGFMAELVHDRDALAALSSRGSNRKVEGSSHYIQMQMPEVVIAAVREVVAAARKAMAH